MAEGVVASKMLSGEIAFDEIIRLMGGKRKE